MDSTRRAELVGQARKGRKAPVSTSGGIAVTSHPLAVAAAVELLDAGGNAVDAAMAAAVVQTVVEPHMTTLAGMMTLLHRRADTGETLCMSASVDAPGASLDGFSAADWLGGRSVAVPGFWAGVCAASARLGRLALADLVAPAVALAADGFEIDPYLFAAMSMAEPWIGRSEGGRPIYMPDGRLPLPGELWRQVELSRTLAALADGGHDAFYAGAFAASLVDVVGGAGGVLTTDDLAGYEVRWTEPLRSTYRGLEVLTSPPPDNGCGIAEALNLVEFLDLAGLGPVSESPVALHRMAVIAEHVKAMAATRGDPRFVEFDVEAIVAKSTAAAQYESLFGSHKSSDMPDSPPPYRPGTDAITVVDAAGDVCVVKHSSLAMPWQNSLFVGGISLPANSFFGPWGTPAPGQRCAIYGAESIILREGQVFLASASPTIGLLPCVLQVTVDVVDHGMTLGEAVPLARFGSRHLGGLMVEVDVPLEVRTAAAGLGLDLEVVGPWSSSMGLFEGVHIHGDVKTACADPRRTGMAMAASVAALA